MKFGLTRKLNLANIDRDIWPYETEDIVVSDADSFEEAQKTADKLVAERIGYYKAQSDEHKKKKIESEVLKTSVPKPLPVIEVQTPNQTPIPVPTQNEIPTTNNQSGPPAEFQVD